MNKTGITYLVWAFQLVLCFSCSSPENEQKRATVINKTTVPVIYSTDMWSPPGDPDDHFDILTLMSLDNIEIGTVILDNTMKANVERTKIPKVANTKAVPKAAKVFNRGALTYTVGLGEPLQSEVDPGLDQNSDLQEGVTLILNQLTAAQDSSVVIITVGSLRDVAAAYNRDQNIFHQKVRRMLVSIGNSYDYEKTDDANTAKDVEAWKRIMTSGLPIDWMPTSPFFSWWSHRGGPSRYCSHWYFMQSELLIECPEKIQNFMRSEGIEPSDFRSRNMWSTAAFVEISGKQCYRENDQIKWLDPAKVSDTADPLEPYVFVPISFSLDSVGVAQWKETPDTESNIRIFRIEDYYLYNESMFQFLMSQFNNK